MDVDRLFKIAIEKKASDLHIKAGNHPVIRVDGALFPLDDTPKLTSKDTWDFADHMLNDYQKRKLEENMDLDLAYSLPGYGRFRGNIYYQRGSLAIAMRIIPFEVKPIKELLLPPVVEEIAMTQRGMVLVTGAAGSGKTTTLASMIDYINSIRRFHIITVEDPIEYLHRDKKSIICQREVGSDVKSFSDGIRSTLREDPDIILVGEMRDLDTIETAIIAAETGHLVLSTLHTIDAPETVNRIVSVFPPHHQRQVRLQLSSIIKAVISMRLIPRLDETGRVPAVEIMVTTPYIQECIKDREKTYLIRDAIASGVSQYKMQTFDQSIYQLYQDGYITFEQGLKYTSSPDNFILKVQGVQSTTDIALEEMEKKLRKAEREKKS